jgi:hypothetical protein
MRQQKRSACLNQQTHYRTVVSNGPRLASLQRPPPNFIAKENFLVAKYNVDNYQSSD